MLLGKGLISSGDTFIGELIDSRGRCDVTDVDCCACTKEMSSLFFEQVGAVILVQVDYPLVARLLFF